MTIDMEPLEESGECGPVYHVQLLKTLPIPGSNMLQALPCSLDLRRVESRLSFGGRVVGGYEVLLAHYRNLRERVEQQEKELTRLRKKCGEICIACMEVADVCEYCVVCPKCGHDKHCPVIECENT